MSDEQHVPTVLQAHKDKKREEFKDYSLHKLVVTMDATQGVKDGAEAELSLLQAEFDLLRLELIPAKMEEEGVETVRYEGIGRVALTGDMYAQTLDKEALYAWLRENNLEDLIQPNVNASTLKATIKARIKKGEETPPEDVVKVTPFVRASITRR